MLPVSNEPWRTRTAFVAPHWSLQVFAFHSRKAEVDAAVVNIFNELGLVALIKARTNSVKCYSDRSRHLKQGLHRLGRIFTDSGSIHDDEVT